MSGKHLTESGLTYLWSKLKVMLSSKLDKESGGTIEGSLTLNGVLVLSSNTYGNTLPSTGVTGQVFFKKV